jgi:hypothetical protein
MIEGRVRVKGQRGVKFKIGFFKFKFLQSGDFRAKDNISGFLEK